MFLCNFQAYMLHGLPSQPSSIPTSLYPIPMSTYDPNPGPNPTPATSKAAGADPSTRPSTSKNRRGRRRKGGGAKGGGKPQDDVASTSERLDDLSLGDGLNSPTPGAVSNPATTFDPSVLYPVWSKVSSSDSEYSDTEGGQANRLKNAHGKVRQCALGCLHALIKVSGKIISIYIYVIHCLNYYTKMWESTKARVQLMRKNRINMKDFGIKE
jgi:hypothetical protein